MCACHIIIQTKSNAKNGRRIREFLCIGRRISFREADRQLSCACCCCRGKWATQEMPTGEEEESGGAGQREGEQEQQKECFIHFVGFSCALIGKQRAT